MSIKEKYEDFLKEVRGVANEVVNNLDKEKSYTYDEMESFLGVSTSFAVIIGNDELYREAISNLEDYFNE